MIKAVIFDMDGVIVDSEPLHIRAERMTLAPYGLNISDAEFQTYMGRTSRFLLQDMIRKHRLPASLDELYPKHMQHLFRLYQEELKPIPGAVELIRLLYQRGFDLAVASSSDKELILIMLKVLHISSLFKTWVSGEEMERVKPFPDIFLEAARRLKQPPECCIVIEDSYAGVLAAKSAGMTCIGFVSPNSPNQDLSKADIIVNNLRELNQDIKPFFRKQNNETY
jgi:HAD superfamily hydrolase (TIGR01509 family)